MLLQRVLEPEVMDSSEETFAYDAMDHAGVNRQFVEDLLAARLSAMLSSETEAPDADDVEADPIDVLDLGAGTARIPIELCGRDDRLRCMAVDLAPSMLDLAKFNVDAAGLLDRIGLDLVDVKSLPYPDGRFAVVISNSIVHHIPEPAGVLAEAVRVAQPGGLLFFRDLVRPPDDAAVKRLVSTYARDESEHQRKLLDDSLRAALSLQEIRDLVSDLGFDPAGVRTTSDRHWTWIGHKQS